MIATRLSAVWQVAGVAGAALLCYLASQSVAAERASLARVDRQIAAEQDAIAKLGTEIATRSRLTQVESWNRQLALQAPRPAQFVAGGVQLASLYAHDGRPALPLDPAIVAAKGPVTQVAFAPAVAVPAPAPVAAAALPARDRALPAIGPAIVKVAVKPRPLPAAEPVEQPLLRVASFVRPRASRLEAATTPVTRAAFPAGGSLLSSDIASLAKAEQAHKKAGMKADR